MHPYYFEVESEHPEKGIVMADDEEHALYKVYDYINKPTELMLKIYGKHPSPTVVSLIHIGPFIP
jgi:hypothetical protein